ncbi:MAG: chemotaxis protein CheW, partial [bacterium]|nr:chemotaxis protein CheW [bacterium]
NTDEALSVIENTRTEDFAELCELFDQVLGAIDRLYDSMLVITEFGGQKAAIAVDGVSFVADCKDSDIEPLPDTADNTEFLSGLVHRPDGSYILIADIGNIYTHACVSE